MQLRLCNLALYLVLQIEKPKVNEQLVAIRHLAYPDF